MAEMTIKLRTDPATGKKDIVVSLRSDDDALPSEHEQLHRDLVQKLIEGGAIRPEEAGRVVVEREPDSGLTEAPAESPREAAPEGNQALG